MVQRFPGTTLSKRSRDPSPSLSSFCKELEKEGPGRQVVEERSNREGVGL